VCKLYKGYVFSQHPEKIYSITYIHQNQSLHNVLKQKLLMWVKAEENAAEY
jgi:hypothetical protein